LINKIQVWSGA